MDPTRENAAPTPEVAQDAGFYGRAAAKLSIANRELRKQLHAPDELVKAATELIDAYNRALPFRPTNFHELMCNLDTALDKVKS